MTNKDRAIYWWRRGVEHGDPPCGLGSTWESTRNMSAFIERVIKTYSVRSVNDAGCGDYSLWMHAVDFGDATYCGFDVNDELIEQNRKAFPSVSFQAVDITTTALPRADLIICRDVFLHIPNNQVIQTMRRFVASGALYLMSTTFPWITTNNEIDTPELGYGCRRLNLLLEPFSFEPPFEFIDEPPWRRQVGLWDLRKVGY